MGTIALVTAPRVTDLTTLARVKAEMRISGTTDDALLGTLIDQASRAVKTRTGELSRMEVTETLRGSGFTDLILANRPVREIVSAAFDGDAVDLDEVAIEIPAAALVRRSSPWTRTVLPKWAIRYWCGYLLPGEDFSTTDVAADAADDSYTLSAGTWPLFVAGDLIYVTGFTDAANNGFKTLATRESDAKITVAEALATEAAGDNVSFGVQTLPKDLERAVISLVRAWLHAGRRDPSVTSKAIDDIRTTYADGGSSEAAWPDEARKLLAPWVRM